MAVTPKTPTAGKSVREEELELQLMQLDEEKRSLESQVYISKLHEETVFRLELLRALNRLTEAIDNLPKKVVELTNPQTPTGE